MVGFAIFVGNLVVIAGLASIAWLVNVSGVDFGLGAVFGMLLYQVAHRLHYGRWFE